MQHCNLLFKYLWWVIFPFVSLFFSLFFLLFRFFNMSLFLQLSLYVFSWIVCSDVFSVIVSVSSRQDLGCYMCYWQELVRLLCSMQSLCLSCNQNFNACIFISHRPFSTKANLSMHALCHGLWCCDCFAISCFDPFSAFYCQCIYCLFPSHAGWMRRM